jgi:hypothetical protein
MRPEVLVYAVFSYLYMRPEACRYADASEVRRYRKHTRVATPRGKLEP